MLSHARRSVPTSRNRSKQGPIFARESLKMLRRYHSVAVLIISCTATATERSAIRCTGANGKSSGPQTLTDDWFGQGAILRDAGDHAGGDGTHKGTFAPRSCYQSPSRRNEHFRDPDLESSLGHCILVDPAILHNDQKVFVGIFDELDIFQRIAIDQQQIGKCAFFHNTKLAGIGIDKSGECH